MKIKDYIKHRWYYFVINLILVVFFLLVIWASPTGSTQNMLYLLSAYFISNLIFVTTDYFTIRHRIKSMKFFISNSGTKELESDYPLDKICAEEIESIMLAHKKYKEQITSEHSNELEFITKWVHDVKVPLSAIQLLVDNIPDEEAHHIQMQLLYIDQNIEKILYHIKSKSLYEDYKIAPINIEQIVNTALKNYAVFFSYKSISLNMDIQDSLVDTDKKWSTYIVSQLISNAVKYANDGGSIEIKTSSDTNKVYLTVKNTGLGIDKSQLKNIFQRGYSSYNVRQEKSTGYGLYLSKRLSDIMGHALSADSVKGEYAEFTISFNRSINNPHITKV